MNPKRIKRLRSRLKITQGELAALVPCSIYAIGNWEQGLATPMPLMQERLLEIEKQSRGTLP